MSDNVQQCKVLHCVQCLEVITNKHVVLHTQGHEEDYTYHFTPDDVAEIMSAVSQVKNSGVSTEQEILKVRQAT